MASHVQVPSTDGEEISFIDRKDIGRAVAKSSGFLTDQVLARKEEVSF